MLQKQSRTKVVLILGITQPKKKLIKPNTAMDAVNAKFCYDLPGE